MTWILNEDSSLKLKLQGLTVSDANSSQRIVPVRFRLPEAEVADLTFPIIVISHNGWYPATERMHDGRAKIPYAPEGLPTWFLDSGPATTTFDPQDSPYSTWFPIPYNFDYQVTVYARFMHEHTIPLVAALAQYDRLHAKYGFLDIPQDGTKRTMQLLGGPELQTGKDNNGKRLFWVNYTVRVFSELVPAIIQPVLATLVNLDLSIYSDITDLQPSNLIESKGLLSVGSSVAWNTSQLNV
jgi:hypothetical protein